ncbi:D-alanyl-D-alanine carboxypeptidase family protein [Pengzhenrongella sp.]|uniref:D-alanyl-D-alanine carboxypeptidase family protein n=1 Tax=Pengzhenrongella sp. TaxID=2888820 RepID=UPI002F9558B4
MSGVFTAPPGKVPDEPAAKPASPTAAKPPAAGAGKPASPATGKLPTIGGAGKKLAGPAGRLGALPGGRTAGATSKVTGKAGAVASTARTLTDPDATGKDKAIAGAAAAATAVGTAVGSPVVGQVAGAVVQSKTGRKLLAGVGVVFALGLVMEAITVGSAVEAAMMVVTTTDPVSVPVGGGICGATGTDPALSADQQANATAIINTVTGRGLTADDATIAIMTALTESGLVNVGHGDLAGTDSRGLFQQRNSWGPREVRMDPAGATGLFLDRLTAPALKLYRTPTLVNVPADARATFAPWLAAQSVQISAFDDGSNYKDKYAQAVGIVTKVAGSAPPSAGKWSEGTTGTAPSGYGTITTPVVTTPGEPAPGCPPVVGGTGPGAWGGYANGQIPLTALTQIPFSPSNYLRSDAAADFIAMSAAFRAEFGYEIGITDGYRTFAQQVILKAEKGALAATPGTSNHGWAVAVDLGTFINTFGSPQRNWMVANAPRFHWLSPDWAQVGNSQGHIPEAWHWEYNAPSGAAA